MNKMHIPWNVEQVNKMFDNNLLRFDNAIQRGDVWDVSRQSLFVDSLLRGYPVPPIFTIRFGDDQKVFDCIDGKQRCTAINKFKNNFFSLKGLGTIQLENGECVELNGLTYDELPEELRKTFDSYSLTFYYFDDVTEDEVVEMMDRLNNGKALTSTEKSRIKSKDLKGIQELAFHDMFTEYLTEKALSGYANEDIIIKTYIQLFESDVCFDSKFVKAVYNEHVFTDEEKERIKNVLDKTHEVLSYVENNYKKRVLSKCLKKTNLLAIIYLVANDGFAETEKVAEFVAKFFDDKDESVQSDEYIAACAHGTNHAINVKARNDAILTCYNSNS